MFIGYAAEKFDTAWKEDETVTKGIFAKQGVDNLSTCKQDIKEIEEIFARYGVTDMGTDKIYQLNDTPSWKRVERARKDIAGRIKRNPEKKFLVVFAIAGHGM